MKIIIGIALLFFSFIFRSIGQDVKNKEYFQTSAVDMYWKTIPDFSVKLYNGYTPNQSYTRSDSLIFRGKEDQEKVNHTIIDGLRSKEIKRLLAWDWIFNFADRFPNDPRKFSLLKTPPPAFFLDIDKGAKAEFNRENIAPIDTFARTHWQKKYDILRQELISSNLSQIEKNDFLIRESHNYVDMYWRTKSTDRFDLKKWTQRLLEFGQKDKNNPYLAVMIRDANYCFDNSTAYGLSKADLRAFVDTLINSNVPEFQKFGLQKRSLILLEQEPFSLKTKSVNGDLFDLNNLRGKIVLLDFWNVGCSGCIQKMPEIKSVYDKYKHKGFEVISVCFSIRKDIEDIEKARSVEIINKLGASWQLIFLSTKPNNLGNQILTKYKFTGFPQYLLLDEEGKLVHLNGDIHKKGGLESLVKKFLIDKI